MDSSVALEVPLRTKILRLRGRAAPANHRLLSIRTSKAPYACQNCCRPKHQSGRRHWTLARRGPQSLLISSSLLCGRHLLQRGGRSCPNNARPAPITPLEATGACPWLAWPGLGLLLARNPALRLPARRRGSFLTDIDVGTYFVLAR